MISLGPFLFAKNETLIQVESTSDFTCDLFSKPAFVLLSSIFSFYFPLALMIVLYAKVFMKIRSQNNFRNVDFNQNHRHRIERTLSESTNTVRLNNKIAILKTQFMAETRITKVLSLIMLCFYSMLAAFFYILYNTFLFSRQKVINK